MPGMCTITFSLLILIQNWEYDPLCPNICALLSLCSYRRQIASEICGMLCVVNYVHCPSVHAQIKQSHITFKLLCKYLEIYLIWSNWFLSYQTLVMKVAVIQFYHTKRADLFSRNSDVFQLFVSVHPSKDNYTLLNFSVHLNRSFWWLLW